MTRGLNAEEWAALESSFWVEGTAGAEVWREGFTWHARGQREGQSGLHVAMKGKRSRRPLYWDMDVGQLCLPPEPTVLTTVVHILIPRRHDTGEPELILWGKKSQAVSSSSSGKT